MRRGFRSFAAGAAALAALCASGGLAVAQDIKERTLRIAFLPTETHPFGLGAKRFAELVEQKSGGKMKVRLFASGVLGGDLQVISALQGGTLDMTLLVSSLLAGVVKDFTLFDGPFLFNTEKEAEAVLDGPVGQAVLAKLPEKGLMAFGFYEYGFRHFTNSRRAINKAEDISGLKIRVSQTPVFIDFVNALGGNAVPLPIPELYTALEQKAVDGADSPISFIRPQKYDEVQKYLALTRHVYNPAVILVSKRVFDRMSPDERKVIQDSIVEAREYQRKVAREQDVSELAELRKTMQVTELPPPEMAKLREKAKPVVEKSQRDLDPALVKAMNDEIAKVRGTN